MSDQVLRARTVPELVDATFSLYRRNAQAYIMVAALASVPALIVNLLVMGSPEDVGVLDSMAALIAGVMSMVTYALMTGVVMKVGSQVYLGGDADVAGAIREVLPRVGRLIVAAILRIPLLFLGLLALGVGMLYVLARWFAVEAAVVLEGKDVLEAFGRSTSLSNGRKWQILRALILGYGIYFLLGIAFGAISAVISNAALSLVVASLITIIAYPFIGLLTMLLYYDSRIRLEGFDVEHLARTLGTTATAPARP